MLARRVSPLACIGLHASRFVCTMAFSAQVWAAALDVIQATESHRFLLAMVDGTLPEANFQYYVLQDSYYLKCFGDALRRVAAHADVLSAAQSAFLRKCAEGCDEAERGLHSSFFDQWGINGDDVVAGPNTLLYTSYLLRVATTRPCAEALAALLPCFWVYTHVGKHMFQLREARGPDVRRPEQYDRWIDLYAGDGFEEGTVAYRALVDAVAAEADAASRSLMQEHFVRACVLEHMFWDAASDLQEWPRFRTSQLADGQACEPRVDHGAQG